MRRLWLIALTPLLLQNVLAFAGRELQGSITVTIVKQSSWVDEDSQVYQSIGRTARHEVRFNPDEAFPDNAQGVATIRGHEVRFSAQVHDVTKVTDKKDGGTITTPRDGSAGVGCPAGAGSPLAVLCAEGAVW